MRETKTASSMAAFGFKLICAAAQDIGDLVKTGTVLAVLAAVAVGGGAVVLSRASATSPYSIAKPSVNPSTLPYTGGSVSVTGTTTYPSGTSLNVLLDGAVVGSTTVTNGAYSTSVSIAANDTVDAVTDSIELQGP